MSADRHRHEALLYATDEELVDVLVPFLTDGFDAGEPMLVGLSHRQTALVRSALPGDLPFELLPDDVYSRPAKVIRAYRDWMTAHLRAGAAGIRLIGALPVTSFGVTWDSWARYEATVNHAYGEFPVWCLCAYDRRATPAAVLRDVERTHPIVSGPGGAGRPSEAYTDPRTYLTEDRRATADPVQYGPPAASLTDPDPAAARAAVRGVDPGRITEDEVEDLVLAVSEVVTNAIVHGRAPVEVRIWPGGDRIVVTVTDAGAGPADPFAGLLPSAGHDTSGRGLWITHQSVNHVTTARRPGRFTIRLTAGNPD
jgi:anti-sigma regulatory factor (Ser/Thr protein kinase)